MGYNADELGLEYQQGQETFFYSWSVSTDYEIYSDRDVKQTIPIHLVPRLQIRGVKSVLPYMTSHSGA